MKDVSDGVVCVEFREGGDRYLDEIDGLDPAQPFPGARTSLRCVIVPKEPEELLV